MAEYRAVGFDLDGTLFDHAGAARSGVESFVTQLGLEPTDAVVDRWFAAEDEQFELWRSGQISFADQRRGRLRGFLPAIGLTVPNQDAALDELFARYLRSYRLGWRLFPDVIETVRALRGRGIRVGVLTNGNAAQQHDKLAVTGLLPLLDTVCVSEEIGFAKPDPRAFAALHSGLGVQPEQLVFVGDHEEHDVAGARGPASVRRVSTERIRRRACGRQSTLPQPVLRGRWRDA